MRLLLKLMSKPLGCICSLLVGLVLLCVVVVALGLWALDHYADTLAAKEIEQRTGFTCTIGRGHVNLLAGTVAFWDIKVENPQPRFPEERFLTIAEVRMEADPLEAVEGHWRLNTLVLDIREVSWVRAPNGVNNLRAFAEGLRGPGGGQQPQEASQWKIDRLALRLDKIRVADYPEGGGEPRVREIPLDYERTFTDVTRAADVLGPVADDLQQAGVAFVLNSFLQGFLDGRHLESLLNEMGEVGGFALEKSRRVLDAGQQVLDAVENIFDSPEE